MQELELLVESAVVGRERSTFSACQVLGSVEAEARGFGQLAWANAVALCLHAMRGILDNLQSMTIRDGAQAAHVAHQAIEMDGHDRLGAWRNRCLDQIGVEIASIGL